MKNETMLGVMLDASRGAVMKPDAVKHYADLLAKMGYNTLMLYTEDTYEVKEEPYFGYLRGRYTQEEIRDIDAYCAARGIELIPCIQTLAHFDGIVRWNAYQPFTDISNILLAGDERTYVLIDRIFASLAASFTSRTVHIGMDEAHMVGLGKYLDQHGFENRQEILVKHLSRVCEIAEKYGFTPMMWSDMFFRLANHGTYFGAATVPEEVRQLIPQNLKLVYWDYYRTDKEQYRTMIRSHRQFEREIVFAGGVWTWRGFAPCSRAALKITEAAITTCHEEGLENVFFTLWGDDGGECSLFSTLPILYYAACAMRGETDLSRIKEGFSRITGESFDGMMALGAANEIEPWHNTHPVGKMYFYSDPFFGLLDRTVPENAPAYFADAEKRLTEAGKESPSFSYLFDTQRALLAVLAKKADLGVRTRAAYRAGDREALRTLAERDYPAVAEAVRSFHRVFISQWHLENKPNGFEMHDIRIGGLLMRLDSCRERLLAFLAGTEKTLPELDEDLLPYTSRGDGIAEEQSWAMVAFPFGKSGQF